MDNRRSFIPSLLIGVILAAIIGYAVRAFTCPPAPQQATQRLTVGPTAKDVRADEITLHLSSMDQVTWTADDAARTLFIEFEEDIFDGTTAANGRHRVRCAGAQCSSGNIKATAKPGSYKYWQILDGTPADARIIIMK